MRMKQWHQLSLVLGSPTEDTGWTAFLRNLSRNRSPGSALDQPPGVLHQRCHRVGARGHAPLLSLRPVDHCAGGGVLIDLITSTGIGINSTLGELSAAYGDQVTIS